MVKLRQTTLDTLRQIDSALTEVASIDADVFARLYRRGLVCRLNFHWAALTESGQDALRTGHAGR